MSKKPKILFLDIESSLMQVGAFDLKPNWTSHEFIFRDWNIICAAWKWLGKKEIHAVRVPKSNLFNDKNVTAKLKKVISEADMVVGHNSDKFDLKKINTRCLFHKLGSFPIPQSVDTLKLARKHFNFSSNKLDYIAKYCDVGGKVDTSRGLWQRIARGDVSALDEMVKYNKNDVKIQEKVYLALRGYSDSHPNMNVIQDSNKLICTGCGGSNYVKNGFKTTRSGKFQRYQCNDCGTNFKDKKAIKTYDGR